MSKRLMPPKKRDKIPGKIQLGLFIRTDEGVIEWSSADPSEKIRGAASKLLAEVMGIDLDALTEVK